LSGKSGTLKLLFRASRDNWGISNTFGKNRFHDLCDNQAPTLIIAKSTKNTVYGGYTEKYWNCKTSWNNNYVKDPEAFLFSVTNKS